LGDGIAITGDDRSTLSEPRLPAGEPVVAPVPPYAALRECLRIQSAARPLSTFSRLFGIDPLAAPARRHFSGGISELSVARTLAGLDSSWTVLNSVATAGGLVDHLAIGPAGVFTIVVHSHAGQRVWVGERTFIVDDQRLAHLAVAEAQAEAISGRIDSVLGDGIADTVVTPCIVLDSPGELRIHQRPGRIEVVTARSFAAWFGALPRLLSPSASAAIAAAAVHQSEWSAGSPAGPQRTAADVVADFEHLVGRVTQARFRRLLWTGLGVVVSYALVIVSASGLTPLGDSITALGLAVGQ
jgi:hypothetical protein